MARIRSIKPEVRISEKVNSWPIPVRYFWVLLWGYCDDYGYGRDNPRLIVADSFPLDDSVTADMVAEWMDLIWSSGVIERFAVDDARFFRVVNWDEHQKISHPAKKVLPDIEDATEVFQHGSGNLRKVTEGFENRSPKQGAGSSDQGAGKQGAVERVSASKKRAPQRKPEVPLPEDWTPKPAHVALARERGVDGRHEELQFRAHAEANDRRQRDWDAAFRMWLGNAKPARQQQQRLTPEERARRTLALAMDLKEIE